MSSSLVNQKNNTLPLEQIYGDTRHITNIFYWFIALITLGLVAGIFIVMSTNSVFAATIISLSLLPVLASLYFVYSGRFEIAATFLAMILSTAVTLTATNGLGIHHLSILGYPVILILASLVTRKRTMWVITLYTILCAGWLVFGELSNLYTPGKLVRSVPGDFFTVAVTLLMTVVMVRVVTETIFQQSRDLHRELHERQLAETHYLNFFENAIDGMFQSTPDGRFIRVNPAMARMYGYNSPAEMIQSVTDISTQVYVDPHAREDLVRRLAAGEKLAEYETLDFRKDGSTFWASMNVQAVRDAQGQILCYEGTLEDITQRKMADEALRDSEQRYRTLFDGILDGVYRSTHEGRFVDVNPAMVKMFGYESRAEMLAVDIKKDMYFAPDDRQSLFLDTGQEKVDIFRMKRRDGSKIWVEDHGRYIHDEHGHVIFHEGILRDVTPRLIAEAERRQAEETLRQFKTIMDDSHDAIFIIDADTSQYKYFNKRASLLLGYSAEELGHKGVLDIATHLTSMEDWLKRVQMVRENNGLIFETGYRRKDGSILPVEVSAQSLVYEHGEPIVAFVRDITERKRGEQEREQLIHELETKNTELTQFAYTVSHDLKSPLVTISGFLGYLEKDTASGDLERVKRDRQRIEEAVNKMQNLLTELLELSRIGRMMNAPETVPFGELVHDALEMVHGAITARGAMIQAQPNLPPVHGDRQRLTEVLQNLLDNAAKYMGDQAHPVIEVGQLGEDSEGGQSIFFVRDNGIGIEPEFHERIFGLFNKLDPSSEGTGIGLALAKKIIEVHGGRIWVESEAGRGSTFYFTLGKPPAAGAWQV